MMQILRTAATLALSALTTACASSPNVLSPPPPPHLVSPVEGVSLRMVDTGDGTLRIAEAGAGNDRLVLMVHGWPESWYVWRHQFALLAAAGYHAVAPDMRGYGASDKPTDLDGYDIHHNCADLIAVMDAVGKKTAVLVGGDVGANIVWNCALLHPDRFSAVVASVVAYYGRLPIDILALRRMQARGQFDHVLYFQELDETGAGFAEQEFDADIRASLLSIYAGEDTPGAPPVHADPAAGGAGWLARRKTPSVLPPWLTPDDFAYLVHQYETDGFAPGMRYYRNFSRNWATTEGLQGKKVQQPALMIKGEHGGDTVEELTRLLQNTVADLRGVHVLDDIGHWVQQEAPDDFNRILIDFLKGL